MNRFERKNWQEQAKPISAGFNIHFEWDEAIKKRHSGSLICLTLAMRCSSVTRTFRIKDLQFRKVAHVAGILCSKPITGTVFDMWLMAEFGR